jgi:EAL domain-containing protein (putative c-di-GMP-specific phosphodiesterase class I)
VDEAIGASGLAVQRLELELTESTLMKDSESALAILEGLRQMGVRIALDDFGTGYSSMAYLRSFPLDQVKIDKSFVSPLGLGHDAVSAMAIVRAIHSLALALGLDVVAEGVESEAQEQVLAELGPHVIVQGYRYARPMSSAQAMQLVWSHHDKGLVGHRPKALVHEPH